jgi:hypothetical protein
VLTALITWIGFAKQAHRFGAGLCLICAAGLGGCWQSAAGLLDESKAVQPFPEGTYLEHDWPDRNSSKEPGQPIIIAKSGAGYRAQWGADGEAFDVILVRFDGHRHGLYAYQATEVGCANEPCTAGDQPHDIYYGLLGLRNDGRIMRIEPEQADPQGAIAKAAGAKCDQTNMCEFTSSDMLMKALARLADITPSLIYQTKR